MRPHRLPIILLSAAALLTGVVITWNGINHHYDAAWYLVYARSVAAGEGFRVPITSVTDPALSATISQWPPLYPLVLAPGAWLGAPYTYARAFTVGLLIVAVLLTYWLALWLTDGKRAAGTAAALLALSVPAMSYDGFSFARSETLFTVGGLAFLLLLRPYRPGDRAPLAPALWAALVVALLTMTRYVGVAFGVMGGLWVMVWAWRTPGGWRRWLPTLAFAAAGVPLLLYALYLRGVTGSLTGTQTTADPFTLAGVVRGTRTLTKEMLHGLSFPFTAVGLSSDWWGLAAAVVVLVGVGVFAVRRGHTLRDLLNYRHALALTYIACYTGMFWLLGARSIIITEETARHYVAVYPVVAALTVSALSRVRAPRLLWVSLLALYMVSGAVATRVPAAGLLYNRADWRTDPILNTLAERLPPETLVHTQYTSHLSMLLGPNVPVRTFGTIGAFEDFACDDLLYPEPYTHAAFMLIDAAALRQTPPPTLELSMREWAAPCGEVVSYENNGFTLLLIVRLYR